MAHKAFHSKLEKEFPGEYSIIMNAANRNNISNADYDNLSLLFAIRRAENGRQGREFGVLTPAAMGKPDDPKNVTLDKQAGWAAASIIKNRQRYENNKNNQPQFNDFVDFMGNRWAPPNVANDPTNLNQNWAKNVKKFKSKYMGNYDLNNLTQDDIEYMSKTLNNANTQSTQTTEQPNSTSGAIPIQSPVIPPLLDEPPKKKTKF